MIFSLLFVLECASLGITGCCTLNCNVGGCYCDQHCYSNGNCCSDIASIGCFPSTTTSAATMVSSISSIHTPSPTKSTISSTSSNLPSPTVALPIG